MDNQFMRFDLIFGAGETGLVFKEETIMLNLKSELLGERNSWNVLDDIKITEKSTDKLFFGNKELCGGLFIYELDEALSEKTFTCYHELLSKTKGYNLCRAWNFIPRITEQINGKIIYEMYNRGRSDAFKSFFNSPKTAMPAATGIDILGDKVVTILLATKNEVQHYKNPLQIDSFNYPEKFGKHAPSFARASKTTISGKNVVFVSGTASIRDCESVFTEDEIKQTDTTIENIEIMLREAGIFNGVKNGEYDTEKIIYIKSSDSFEKVKKHIRQKHPLFKDGIFLKSNICREELDVEISFTAWAK